MWWREHNREKYLEQKRRHNVRKRKENAPVIVARAAARKVERDERLAKIREMWAAGYEEKEIADALGISKFAVSALRYKSGDTKKRRKAKTESFSVFREIRMAFATPKWVDPAALIAIHKEAVRRRRAGEDVEVDHIVPIRGKRVSGLNVPWNLQILPAELNNWKRAQHHDNLDLL